MLLLFERKIQADNFSVRCHVWWHFSDPTSFIGDQCCLVFGFNQVTRAHFSSSACIVLELEICEVDKVCSDLEKLPTREGIWIIIFKSISTTWCWQSWVWQLNSSNIIWPRSASSALAWFGWLEYSFFISHRFKCWIYLRGLNFHRCPLLLVVLWTFLLFFKECLLLGLFCLV